LNQNGRFLGRFSDSVLNGFCMRLAAAGRIFYAVSDTGVSTKAAQNKHKNRYKKDTEKDT